MCGGVDSAPEPAQVLPTQILLAPPRVYRGSSVAGGRHRQFGDVSLSRIRSSSLCPWSCYALTVYTTQRWVLPIGRSVESGRSSMPCFAVQAVSNEPLAFSINKVSKSLCCISAYTAKSQLPTCQLPALQSKAQRSSKEQTDILIEKGKICNQIAKKTMHTLIKRVQFSINAME